MTPRAAGVCTQYGDMNTGMNDASVSLLVMAGLVPASHERPPVWPGTTRCPEQVRA